MRQEGEGRLGDDVMAGGCCCHCGKSAVEAVCRCMARWALRLRMRKDVDQTG